MRKTPLRKRTREEECAFIWGNAVKKAPEDYELDELATDKHNTAQNGKGTFSKTRSASSKEKKSKGNTSSMYNADPLLPVSLYFPIHASTSQADLRSLFVSYRPLQVKISKAKKRNSDHTVAYNAQVKFANRALALHALKTFQGTDQSDKLHMVPGARMELAVLRSRQENRRLRFLKVKTKKQVFSANGP